MFNWKKIVCILMLWLTCISTSFQENDERQVFHNNRAFEVVSLNKSSEYPSSQIDASICEGWVLSQENIQLIIREARLISTSEWHILFDHLPCVMNGTLEQSGSKFEFSVNAGSWLKVSSSDTTLLFANFKKEYEKYFLSPVWEEK